MRPEENSLHPLRIGGTIHLALRGVEPGVIQTEGGWNSDAFKSYVYGVGTTSEDGQIVIVRKDSWTEHHNESRAERKSVVAPPFITAVDCGTDRAVIAGRGGSATETATTGTRRPGDYHQNTFVCSMG